MSKQHRKKANVKKHVVDDDRARESGRIVLVEVKPLGSPITLDYVAADTFFFVEDPSDFDEEGGILVIADEQANYTAVDDETGEITLDAALAGAPVEGDFAYLYPISNPKFADVQLVDEDTDVIRAVVPKSMNPLVAEGTRDGEENQELAVIEFDEDTSEWTVIDLPQGTPNLDPEYIEGFAETIEIMDFIDQDAFSPEGAGASRQTNGSGVGAYQYIRMDDGSTNARALYAFTLPDDYLYEEGPVQVRLIFTFPSGGGAVQDVRLTVAGEVGYGVIIGALAENGYTESTDTDDGTVYHSEWYDLDGPTGVPVTPDPDIKWWVNLSVGRNGGHVDDTTSLNFRFLGIEYKYIGSAPQNLLQGNQGDPGDEGPSGAQGAQGFQGYQGYQGGNGLDGLDGGPGPQGFQGSQGFQGFQGTQGFQGPGGLISTLGTGFDETGGQLDLDITEFSSSTLIAPFSDTVLGYDLSSAAHREIPAWALLGEGGPAGFFHWEDFGLTGPVNLNGYPTTTFLHGWLTPIYHATGGGMGPNEGLTEGRGTQARPGRVRMYCGTNSAGYAGFSNGGTGTFPGIAKSILLGGGIWRFGVHMLTPSVISDGTNRYFLIAGLVQDTNNPPSIGCWFEYKDDVNGGKWFCVTDNTAGGARTETDSGITVTISTDYNLEIEVNAAGTSVEFYIDGTLVATHTTDIPTATGDEIGPSFYLRKTVGASSRNFFSDWCYLGFEATTQARGTTRFW